MRLTTLTALAALLVAAMPTVVSAVPIVSGSTTINEPNGTYSVEIDFAVFDPGDAANPLPLGGALTYLYGLGVTPGSFLGIIEFEVPVPNAFNNVFDAGFIPGSGVAPSGTTVGLDNIVWQFTPALGPGQSSEDLFIHSELLLGNDLVATAGEFGFDAQSTVAIAVPLTVDSPSPIPEPSTVALFGLGLAGLGFSRRR